MRWRLVQDLYFGSEWILEVRSHFVNCWAETQTLRLSFSSSTLPFDWLKREALTFQWSWSPCYSTLQLLRFCQRQEEFGLCWSTQDHRNTSVTLSVSRSLSLPFSMFHELKNTDWRVEQKSGRDIAVIIVILLLIVSTRMTFYSWAFFGLLPPDCSFFFSSDSVLRTKNLEKNCYFLPSNRIILYKGLKRFNF